MFLRKKVEYASLCITDKFTHVAHCFTKFWGFLSQWVADADVNKCRDSMAC